MKTIEIALPAGASARVRHGAALLERALEAVGANVKQTAPLTAAGYRKGGGMKIALGDRRSDAFIQELERQEVLLYHTNPPEGEGFYVATLPGGLIVVAGGGDTGVLYGCQELCRIIAASGGLPPDIAYGDAPVMKLRGPVVPLQLTRVEPPRRTYEYPITPGRFPWFYDQDMWVDHLDRMFEQRCNVIYVWSGHPFSSLVKLPEYPEALEVTEEEFARNVALFRWLAEECDRRGIWLVLKFYNIHIPLPFAEKHGLDLHQPKPLPLTSDYYIRSISAFIRSFPNVGLMVCLGEALQGALYGTEWFNDTILRGVREGLKDWDGELPPIIVRAHAIPAEKVMEAAIPLYGNLYTEAKYNGESLTTYTPRGRWQDIHRHLSELNSVHLFNVHILANLEPFRYGAPGFIQKCVQAAKYRLHANGIHLYPLFYWDWPYAPDRTSPRLKQVERDWIWFEAWFRYAWNPDLDPQLERLYWTRRLAEAYGSEEAGEAILDAYESAGECAPKLLRRFGITEGNRQTMSLGMTVSQLINPEQYRAWKELWECQAPEGERLETYVERELGGEAHVGETPPEVLDNVETHARLAEEAIARARGGVERNREEFERLAQDVRAIALMTRSYAAKARAALRIARYRKLAAGDYASASHLGLLEEALPELRRSLETYRELTALTDRTYLYANSMQTPMRKVPFPDGEKYAHWRDCLPLYEAEFAAFEQSVAKLRQGQLPPLLLEAGEKQAPYAQAQAAFELHSPNAETYTLDEQCALFTEGDMLASNVADELRGLTGIRFSVQEASRDGVELDIELKEPASVLIGYFRSDHPQWLQVPDPEVNTHADDRGGLAPKIVNAIKVYFQPSVNIHAFAYEAGRHRIVLGRGAYVVAGIVKAGQPIRVRDVDGEAKAETLDWMFEPWR